jgi:hypothetical protein
LFLINNDTKIDTIFVITKYFNNFLTKKIKLFYFFIQLQLFLQLFLGISALNNLYITYNIAIKKINNAPISCSIYFNCFNSDSISEILIPNSPTFFFSPSTTAAGALSTKFLFANLPSVLFKDALAKSISFIN